MKMEALPASETQYNMKNYTMNKVQRKKTPSVRHKPSSEPCNLSQISSVIQNWEDSWRLLKKLWQDFLDGMYEQKSRQAMYV
jgi:hypothetical protein